jgi:hypothetical protein
LAIGNYGFEQPTIPFTFSGGVDTSKLDAINIVFTQTVCDFIVIVGDIPFAASIGGFWRLRRHTELVL